MHFAEAGSEKTEPERRAAAGRVTHASTRRFLLKDGVFVCQLHFSEVGSECFQLPGSFRVRRSRWICAIYDDLAGRRRGRRGVPQGLVLVSLLLRVCIGR